MSIVITILTIFISCSNEHNLFLKENIVYSIGGDDSNIWAVTDSGLFKIYMRDHYLFFPFTFH
jgi:hypothetical protein